MNSLFYTKFRFCTVIDWIDIEFWTLCTHQGWRVRKNSHGMFSYVTGLDPITGNDIEHTGIQGKSTPTNRFRARIQNPDRFACLKEALATVADLAPNAALSVRGIEIAFDAYRLPGTTDEELAEMTAIMLHEINRPDGANSAPRIYSWKGTPELRYGINNLLQPVSEGFTAMYGNRGDDHVVRGYLKNYDTIRDENNKDERITLDDPLKHRARIEPRLQGFACPIRAIEELETFRFESLASFFKFRQADSQQGDLVNLLANKSASLGSVVTAAGETVPAFLKKGRVRKNKPTTRASPLNEKARQALRDLTKRWQSPAGRGKVKTLRLPECSNYENSVGLDRHSAHKREAAKATS